MKRQVVNQYSTGNREGIMRLSNGTSKDGALIVRKRRRASIALAFIDTLFSLW
jgi:hypothetical protein